MERERDFIITADSTCDLPLDYINENKLGILSLGFSLEDTFYEGEDILKLDYHEFYQKMRAGSMPQTVQVTPGSSQMFFEKYLNEGKNIIHIALSSALSGTYNSNVIAMNELKDKYPERKITVIDSLSASMGEGLLVYYAVQMMNSGADYNSIVSWIEDNKQHICHYFTVDDLFHLHRGGRVSKTAAIVGSMLGVKPILHVDDDGRLIPIGKVRGRKQSLTALVDHMAEQFISKENKIVFISHGDCIEDAQFVKNLVFERFGIENFVINYIGPVIGSHSGPGTVALFFYGNNR